MGKASLSFYVPLDKEEFKQICLEALPKIVDTQFTVEDDVIIITEGRVCKSGSYKGMYGAYSEMRYNNNNVTIDTSCKGLFAPQKRHAEDFNTAIKTQIERALKKVEDDPDVVRCPKCGSSQIEIVKRGWTLATGFLGSGKNQRICKNCMYQF